jgi:diguanylate cyclase (GGDEF)-like protein/PAS domain S-box-containing protein
VNDYLNSLDFQLIQVSAMSDDRLNETVADDRAPSSRLVADWRGEAAGEYINAIVQSSDDAIISKTLDGIVTSWNPGAQTLFGYNDAEMIGQPMLRLFPPDKQDEELFILEKIVSGEKVDHFETVRMHKDGRLLNVSVTISPIRNAAGHVVGASKIARDITAQTAAQRRVQLISSVFTHTNEAIVITDAAGLIVEVNQAFVRISGYERHEVTGHSHHMFASSRQGPPVFDKFWQALREQDHCQGELWSRRKDGEAYAGLLTVNAVRNPAGAVQNYVALFADITPLRKQQERLEHVAHFDALTDLPNRLLLSDRLTQAMVASRNHGGAVAVAYLDLDGFKAVNDRHGHDVGDELLIALSQRIRAALKPVDTLARIGGDEFVAVLLNIDGTQDCCEQVQKIVCACAEPIVLHDHLFHISASVGVTLFPHDDAAADQLLRHADRAMYEAKQAGKNRFHLFDAAQDIETKVRAEKIARIKQALAQREFALYYQPKVNMRTGQVIGAEALVRWLHPEHGVLPPIEFLPLIETHFLSEALGAWVIAQALTQMSQWQLAGLHLPVSVNVSARQLQQGDFARQLGALLAQQPDVDPKHLELEVLETSALDDIDTVSAIMRDCCGLGVHFSVDDFGTGYSSLTYLKRLPAQTLKIDQSFVRGMLTDPEDLAIVQGVIGLAAAFGRQVIAEGVETASHAERLLQLGCELAQGYGIARPMPAHDLAPWVAN